MIHRYPLARMAPDYLRAGLGLVVAGLPLWAFELPAVVRIVFACLMVLFGMYAFDALRRQRSRVETTESALVMYPAGTRIDWNGLTRLRLAAFALRRDGKQGWMELRLDSAGGVSAWIHASRGSAKWRSGRGRRRARKASHSIPRRSPTSPP